ncbi:uncharacterized protein LOC119635219 [Glossina fuscipes]|uniref:Uncharacterized protein LOC119635219 n=1 Tax=Glossina fuscipes TaxID=7396 RepID=A0A8U0WL39_9MUSC|nr:uncharacterized protein LOC119635219 [Glossina fuscipes]
MNGLLCSTCREGSVVYITHLVSYKQLFIAAINTLEDEDIFAFEIRKCPPFVINEPLNIGDIVFVSNINNAEQNCCYREVVLGSSGKFFKIHNVDRECTHSLNQKCCVELFFWCAHYLFDAF